MAEVLVIGGGAREHALVSKLSTSPHVSNVYAAPGNAGIENSVPIDTLDINGQLRFARDHKIDLTVVGPEGPLAAGVVDAFMAENLRIFGPTKDAAKLETSKNDNREFNLRHGIQMPPTYPFYEGQQELAKRKVRELGVGNSVIKADGPAEGKGVTLPATVDEADKEIDGIMAGKYPLAGKDLQIQQRLRGEELSAFVLSDGTHIQVIPKFFRDYKRIKDGDMGPNTGGMGGFGPVSTDWRLMQMIEESFARPKINGMKEDGREFRGVLYLGLMLNDEGVTEFETNARFGDPETQLLMPLIDGDLYEVLYSCTEGDLPNHRLNYFYGFTTAVVLASEGYPDSPKVGVEIEGLERNFGSDVHIFHYGTRRRTNGAVETGSGRVLTAVAYDNNSPEGSRSRAYTAVDQIQFSGMQYRKDIASSI